jgi:hypothetical protein
MNACASVDQGAIREYQAHHPAKLTKPLSLVLSGPSVDNSLRLLTSAPEGQAPEVVDIDQVRQLARPPVDLDQGSLLPPDRAVAEAT